MKTTLVYSPGLAAYDLGPAHPLRPERFTLAVSLMEAYGLIAARGSGNAMSAPVAADAPIGVVAPTPATDEDLERVHDAAYLRAVRDGVPSPAHGLGTGDTPVFPDMHEASALVAGATLQAVRDVLSGETRRSFSVAGGLHHAHRGSAAGFCVHNDAAVAIAAALAADDGLRVLYVDFDAHHGDGVQEAFYDEPRVLTVSVHQSGRTLFPGTGWPGETGEGAGLGASANVPMPPGAGDACYRLAFDEAVAPLARAFLPDVIVAQCGADALHSDPLTDLGLTLPGHRWLVRAIAHLSDELCDGRLVALGGGGYAWHSQVPRAWASTAAVLAGADLPGALPPAWREAATAVSGVRQPADLMDDPYEVDPELESGLLAVTRDSVARVRSALAR